MHELSIATEIHRAALTELETRGGGRLEVVAVAIGELAGVEPELLAFAWKALTLKSEHADCRLEIEYVPSRQLCALCGEIADRQPGSWLRLCPQCEGPLRVEGGQELVLVSLSFESRSGQMEVST